MTDVHRSDTAPEQEQAQPGGAALLDVRDLRVEFGTGKGSVHAVNGLSYTLGRGETLAILGESGSGKSVSAQAVMGTLPSPPARVTGGEVHFGGVDLLGLRERDRRQYRGRRLAMIYQDALSALNPVFTVGNQIAEMFRIHRGLSRRQAMARAVDLMELVHIPDSRTRVHDYPHQFSGGMRQRVMIAMALALEPDVLIADEPTTALDVTVQAQIMRLLRDLQEQMHMGLILITHDLGVVADVADRIVVMYAGAAVEQGEVYGLYGRPAHPYTRGLLGSVPRPDQGEETLRVIPGSPPDMADIPAGCPFHPRCRWRRPVCEDDPPDLREVEDGRWSACHFAEEVLEA
ncbi:MAG: ABC transporter ATP-binding protein [Nocardioidaceae bacterium]